MKEFALKALLLLMVYDPKTGVIEKVWQPLQGYPDHTKCEEALRQEMRYVRSQVLYGKALWGKCISAPPPTDTSTDVPEVF
jgi:hypothetical protein